MLEWDFEKKNYFKKRRRIGRKKMRKWKSGLETINRAEGKSNNKVNHDVTSCIINH